MTVDRRRMLAGSAAALVAFGALARSGLGVAHSANPGHALIPDPDGLLDLPRGFSYRVLTRTGQPMADGFTTPGRPDGMACFAHPADPGRVVLVRNHEMFANITAGMPFGEGNALLGRLPHEKVYDARGLGSEGGLPFFGGTTTLTVDLASQAVVRDHLSLIGTIANCAGGATPWGTWLTCEEQVLTPGEQGARQRHGFVFEVPSGTNGLVDPVPLTAMGRFVHEATATDPATGIVYLTEDSHTGLFYRFIPAVPGKLAEGGRLQALAIDGAPSADLRNWPRDWSEATVRRAAPGEALPVRWIDLEDVEAPAADLAQRGFAAGAAMFSRGEGMALGAHGKGRSAVFFTSTQGGAAMTGQVWRHDPDPRGAGGTLTLVYESPGADTLDLCDNLAVSPWGDLILCEDGRGDNYLRALTPGGAVLDLARNAHPDQAEFCGACFSPDGRTMFVNVQNPGITYAVSGPWERLGTG